MLFTENTDFCTMVLFDPKTNQVQENSGLNWGSSGGHTNPGDGYVPIRTSHIKMFPNLFPTLGKHFTISIGGRAQRQSNPIKLIWDDGTRMDASLEGTQEVNGLQYPKQLSSFPSKNILGVYIRTRLGLAPTAIVTKADLDSYGRDNISISLLQDGTYYVDFSV